jgi:hypothetical protein
MWVGIGCGGLFLLSLIGGAVAWYFTYRAAQSALAAASSLATPLAPPTETAEQKGGEPPGATDSSGAPVSGACAKAAECCRKIIQKTNSGAQAEAGCLALKQLPEANCVLPLSTYQKSAQLLGVKCD